jgi:glucose/arabinose dehydrogenase
MTGLARVATLLAVALLSAGSASAQQPAPAAAPAPAPQAAPASTAAVASVKTTNGKVLLNRAAAYDPATKDQRLLVGDRLVVLEGGAITLRFDGGCEQTIDMATVYTVRPTGACAHRSRPRLPPGERPVAST